MFKQIELEGIPFAYEVQDGPIEIHIFAEDYDQLHLLGHDWNELFISCQKDMGMKLNMAGMTLGVWLRYSSATNAVSIMIEPKHAA